MQENEDKRNTSPVERRTETTGKTVCTFSSLVRSERRCHRRVGYKNSVSRFHLLTMSKCYGICKDISNGSYKTGVGKSFEVYFREEMELFYEPLHKKEKHNKKVEK